MESYLLEKQPNNLDTYHYFDKLDPEEKKKLIKKELKCTRNNDVFSNLTYTIFALYPQIFSWFVELIDNDDILKKVLDISITVIYDYINDKTEYPINISVLEENFKQICEKTTADTWAEISWHLSFRKTISSLSQKYPKNKEIQKIAEIWITNYYNNSWLEHISYNRCDKLIKYILKNAKLNTGQRSNLVLECFINGMRRCFDECLENIITQDDTKTEFIRLVEHIIGCKSVVKINCKMQSIAGMITSLCRKIEICEPSLMTYMFHAEEPMNLVTFASCFPYTKRIIKQMVEKYYLDYLEHGTIGQNCLLNAAQYSTLDVFLYLYKILHPIFPNILIQEKSCLVNLSKIDTSCDTSCMETTLNVFSAAICCNRSPTIAKFLVNHLNDFFLDVKEFWIGGNSLETIFDLLMNKDFPARSILKRLNLVSIANQESLQTLCRIMLTRTPAKDIVLWTSTKYKNLIKYLLSDSIQLSNFEVASLLILLEDNQSELVKPIIGSLKPGEKIWEVYLLLLESNLITCINQEIPWLVLETISETTTLLNQEPELVIMILKLCFNNKCCTSYCKICDTFNDIQWEVRIMIFQKTLQKYSKEVLVPYLDSINYCNQNTTIRLQNLIKADIKLPLNDEKYEDLQFPDCSLEKEQLICKKEHCLELECCPSNYYLPLPTGGVQFRKNKSLFNKKIQPKGLLPKHASIHSMAKFFKTGLAFSHKADGIPKKFRLEKHNLEVYAELVNTLTDSRLIVFDVVERDDFHWKTSMDYLCKIWNQDASVDDSNQDEWFPKQVFRYKDKNTYFEKLNLQPNYPTDGMICQLDDGTFIKDKPNKDLTIDLNWNGRDFLTKEDIPFYNWKTTIVIHDIKIGVWRFYYQNNTWVPIDFRSDKKRGNPMHVIAQLSQDQKHPWKSLDLNTTNVNWYQGKKSKFKAIMPQGWYDIMKGDILSLGCGYVRFNHPGNHLYVDNDPEVLQLNDMLIDLNKEWTVDMQNNSSIAKRINLLEMKPLQRIFGTINMNMVLSHLGNDIYLKEISKCAKKGTILKLSFLDFEIIKEYLPIQIDGECYIKEFNSKQLKVYFPKQHSSPILEYKVSSKEITNKLEKHQWIFSSQEYSDTRYSDDWLGAYTWLIFVKS